MDEVTLPAPGGLATDGARQKDARVGVLVSGLGFLLWFAAWGCLIDLVWRKAGIPERAAWGHFYSFWVPASWFLFTGASLAFASRDARQTRAVIVRQGYASLSLLAFLLLEMTWRRTSLAVWFGSFLVASILIRGACFLWPLWRDQAATVPGRAASLRLFVGSALVYVLLVPWVVQTLPVAGDEAHYLLISHSIVVDRDFDLRNNYERGDYRSFHPGHISPQASETVSAHGVGFPLLLAPAYALGGRLGAMWVVALAAAFLSLNIYWFCLEVSGSPQASLQAWALAAFTVPLVTYGNQLFPEVPAALGTLYAYRQFRARAFRGGRAFLGLAASFVAVFLKVRYAPLNFVLWTYLFARLARNRRWVWPCAAALVAFAVALPLLDAWFLEGAVMLRRWGTLSAWLAMSRPNDFHLRASLGLLFDQKNGLLMYSPIYALSSVGVALLLRDRRPEGFVIPAAVALYVYVLIALSHQLWHGEFSPAPRYLVVLIPLLVGPLAVALDRCRGLLFGLTRAALGAYSLAMAVTLLLMPRWRFRTKTGQSMVWYMVGQGLSVNLIDWLPSFIVSTAYSYFVAWVGFALVTVMVAYFCATADR